MTPSINILWSKKLRVCKVQIHYDFFFTFFWLKYESSIHNIAFSIEKPVLSESGEKYAQIKQHLYVKTVQNISKQICQWILM